MNLSQIKKVKVKNKKGTGDKEKCPNCGPWIDHWKELSGQEADMCSHHDCFEMEDLVGAHIITGNHVTQKEFIVPLCRSHNHPSYEDIFEVYESLLISANVAESCGKSKPFKKIIITKSKKDE